MPHVVTLKRFVGVPGTCAEGSGLGLAGLTRASYLSHPVSAVGPSYATSYFWYLISPITPFGSIGSQQRSESNRML
jgi:hypothetical protein